jgi:hypothetical protein
MLLLGETFRSRFELQDERHRLDRLPLRDRQPPGDLRRRPQERHLASG